MQRWCLTCERWYHDDCLSDKQDFNSMDELYDNIAVDFPTALTFEKAHRDMALSPIRRGMQWGPSGYASEQVMANKSFWSQDFNNWRTAVDTQSITDVLQLTQSNPLCLYLCTTCLTYI